MRFKAIKKKLAYFGELDARAVFESDLSKKYGDCNLYFNHGIKSNSIKRISEDDFSIFNYAIVLWNHCNRISKYENGFPLLFPIKFAAKWNVEAKMDSNGVYEYHFREFNIGPLHTILTRFPRMTVVLYGYNNGSIAFYGYAQVRSVERIKETENEWIVKLKCFKEFVSPQSGTELEKIIQLEMHTSSITPVLNEHPIHRHVPCLSALLNYNETTIERLKTSILANSNASNNVIVEEISTAEGKTWRSNREGQAAIPWAALEVYSNQCALCDVTDSGMLQATHVIPWSRDVMKRGLLRNIICLCVTHHKLFDLGRLIISDDYTIKYTSRFLDECKNSEVFMALRALTRYRIRLPNNKFHWPSPEFLRTHRIQCEDSL